MFVCICNQVTDKQIHSAVEDGMVRNFKSLSSELNVGTCCGKCKSCAKKVLREAIHENPGYQSFPSGLIPAFSPG